MAKGIIPLTAFRKTYGRADRGTVRKALLEAFTKAIHQGNSKGPASS